ncbi:N-terminal double-transmembrane domain-containing protein [Tistlia consotensis]|uniref:N-terminal double-transmembrane domain-containing protein n=1 Tax=Tistlia consotensis USBA 355 TaxID=560819 RepID=A0A1Y6C7N5_9PROT|nr:DUF4159 domain-containing protein [Tistlia consotensis]SMF46580.1 N-terminal double-transmembrane domain-containing protein [Tistlia consotensis USBA 355]SNR78221.1 N-terminal double-transmembrane domain-containing protein [Tistlia consotensis]
MISIGSLAFANPWLLAALIGLPAIWWLLRVTPPAPRRQTFPAIRLLLGLTPPEETPARTPLWLVALRMLLAALVILALARPVLNPTALGAGDGPVVLVVDDGWTAARDWQARRDLLRDLVSQAARASRPVILLTSAPTPGAETAIQELDPAEARGRIESLAPKPWPIDRAALMKRLDGLKLDGPAPVFWLSDGLEAGADQPDAAAFAERLRRIGPVTVYRTPAESLPHLLLPPENDGLAFGLVAERPAAGFEESLGVTALDDQGRMVGTATLDFAADATRAKAPLELPAELRNRVTSLAIDHESSAGARVLLDERWRRRPVGLVVSTAQESAQPLLSELYYLDKALQPFTEVRRGSLDELMKQDLAILVLADLGRLGDADTAKLETWVEDGGTLLRFAGPRLADDSDGLLPVKLRKGDRTLGGSLTWDTPATLAPFPPNSPLAGLKVPDDVSVKRQVLAEPSLDLAERTWARLADGTPLITGAKKGKGWLVLVHTTANAEWSNLALSGLFVNILRRIVAISAGVEVGHASGEPQPPLATLDGFGRLGSPPAEALAADQQTLAGNRAGPTTPPGYYGTDESRSALNLSAGIALPAPMAALPLSVTERGYGGSEETDLLPWLLVAALLLGLLDLLIGLALRGLLSPRFGRAAGALLLVGLAGLAAGSGRARAQADEAQALASTLETRLAYVVTGVPAVDQVTRAGMEGLTRMLTRRTSVEPADPIGVELGHDELAFYPLLYWAITPDQHDLDSVARRELADFMNNGGTLVVDLREPGGSDSLLGAGTEQTRTLRRLMQGIEIPPLAPIPPDHVLTKSFYLMQDFPGRYDNGTLWVQQTDETDKDGVASLIVGSNDWAAAWAIDDSGRALYPVVPGGERQREMAFRFGINLVMYALTGNYKADQVHVPFILERLGQ